MRALFTTERLQEYAGSELVILEAAEALRARGWECLIAANAVGRPLTDDLRRAHIDWTTNLSGINAFDFDLVWIQHLTAPLLRYETERSARERTLFAFAHLSPFTHFETIVTRHEDLLADIVLANSVETAGRLRELAVPPGRIQVFHNAAPAAFHNLSRTRAGPPKQILVVAKDLSDELRGAIALLRRRANVKHIGGDGPHTRVSPRDIEEADVVVTIGKTVQYALAGRVPVYVYNGFGGPGYLDAENFDVAAAHNFSGRCCGTRRTPNEIADDILALHGKAAAFVASLEEDRLASFRLDLFLERLIAMPAASNLSRALALSEERGYLERERSTAEVVRARYQLVHRLHRRLYGAGFLPWFFRTLSRRRQNLPSS